MEGQEMCNYAFLMEKSLKVMQNCLHDFEKFFLQNPQNWKKRIQIFLTISLDSDKIQKRTIPHLKAENLNITVYFMHFLQKITLRVAMDKNVCIIFFVTVSMLFLHLSCISNHFSVNHEKPISFCQFSPLIGHSDQHGGYSAKIKLVFANLTKNG